MPLPGDCQINLQLSSLDAVGVRDGVSDGGGAVGVSDTISVGVADGDAVGVLEGIGVLDGLGVSVSVGLSVAEGSGVGVPRRAVIGADSAAQASMPSVSPMKSSFFIIPGVSRLK